MRIDTAIQLIANIVFMPGWSFEPSDHSNRFEGTVKIHVTYPARRSERELAPEYAEDVPGGARADFAVPVDHLDTVTDLYRCILDDVIMPIWLHESREFLRVAPTNWAPFHPHRLDGMQAYGSPQSDLQFGLA